MDMTDISNVVNDYILEIVLILGGLLAVIIAIQYVRKKESFSYKALTALGFIFGILMVIVALVNYQDWILSTALIVAIAGFALIIRPIRNVHISPLFALLVMAIVYISLGTLTTVGSIDVSFLAEGWPRIIVSFIIGAIFYMLFNFAESIIKIFGKVLNWWPLLFILGLVCIAEGVCIYFGYGSVYDLILPYLQN